MTSQVNNNNQQFEKIEEFKGAINDLFKKHRIKTGRSMNFEEYIEKLIDASDLAKVFRIYDHLYDIWVELKRTKPNYTKTKEKFFGVYEGEKEIADIEDFIKSKEDEIENIYKKMQLHENKIADLKDQLFSLKSEKTRTIDKLKESKIKVKRRNKQLKQKFEAEAKRTNAIKKKVQERIISFQKENSSSPDFGDFLIEISGNDNAENALIYFEIVYDSWVEIIDDKPNYEKYKRDVWQKSKIQKRLKYRNISLEKEKAKIEEAKELREKMREDKKKRKKKGKYRKNKTKIMNKNEKPEVYDNIDPTDSLSGFVNPRGLSDSDTEIDDTYIFSV